MVQSRVVVEAGTSETKTETETEAGSRDLIDKSVTSETKTETEAWAAETKTETEAIKIWSRGRPRDRGRSSRPTSLVVSWLCEFLITGDGERGFSSCISVPVGWSP